MLFNLKYNKEMAQTAEQNLIDVPNGIVPRTDNNLEEQSINVSKDNDVIIGDLIVSSTNNNLSDITSVITEIYPTIINNNTDIVIKENIVSNNNGVEIEEIYSGPEENLEENFFKEKVIVEVSRFSWRSPNYLKGCLWSPDGTCCLTAVSGNGFHIIDLPKEFYDAEEVSSERPLEILESTVHVPEGGNVYDYCWYPGMNSMSPVTCSWIASRQHEPIHMWDAFHGRLRCTYRGYDYADEVEAAISVNFSDDGSKIYAGYKKSLKIFKTAVPGREYESYKTKIPVSTIATSAFHPDLIAIGSWNSSIILCDPRDKDLNITNKLSGHSGGVTLIKFSQDGSLLISGSRKENKILCWDMRNTKIPYYTLNRTVGTNQRIYFDMSTNGKWLISGDTNGLVHIYDLERTDDKNNIPVLKFPLHKDCCNGVSIHPFKTLLATATGQIHYTDENLDPILKPYSFSEENSLIFWWFGKYNILN